MARIEQMSLAHALSVVAAMRPLDRACVQALLGDISDEAFAANRWQSYGPAWALVDESGRALSIGGVSLPNDWLGVMWLVVRDGLPLETWRKLIRHTRTVIGNALDHESSVYRHRLEAHVLEGWGDAQKLARALGFEFEGTRRAAGRGGENIQQWAIVGPVKG